MPVALRVVFDICAGTSSILILWCGATLMGLEEPKGSFLPFFLLVLGECILLGVVALGLFWRAHWAPSVVPWLMLAQYALVWGFLQGTGAWDGNPVLFGLGVSVAWLIFFSWYRRRAEVVNYFDRHRGVLG